MGVMRGLAMPIIIPSGKNQNALLVQGAELECDLMEDDNMTSFVSAWVSKAASAQGSCATIGAQLLGSFRGWPHRTGHMLKFAVHIPIYFLHIN